MDAKAELSGGPPPADASPDQPASRRLLPELRALARELRSWPTLLLLLFCLLVGIPVTILLTPSQQLVAVGQHLSVGARTPSLSVSGPAQLVQIGNTELDIPRLDVLGPLRPRLTMGPVLRNDEAAAALDPATSAQAQHDAVASVGDGFLRWYLWGAVGLAVFALAATAMAGCARMLVTLRRHSDGLPAHLSVAQIWRRSVGQIRRMTIIAVTVALLAWAVAGALAYSGAMRGLESIGSLSELVGANHLSPPPVGPRVFGYSGAVIGDSRAARVGGPPIANGSPEDAACQRSADSLAAEVSEQVTAQVLNLTCAGASIATGLRGPLQQGGIEVPSQVGRLKQVDNLKFVVVEIGPNDLSWTDFIRYCYAVDNCADNLTQGEFGYRLAAFDKDYGELLQDLNELPSHPQVIVMTSYDVFTADADCWDAHGPAPAKGLNPDKIALLTSRNTQLNDVLTAGAKKYQFDVATPRLAPLCAPSIDRLGPDLQGLTSANPFHPTAVGMLRMTSSVVRLVTP